MHKRALVSSEKMITRSFFYELHNASTEYNIVKYPKVDND